jgi:(1->4)-alpha-D-glucan 1-alpha-D-glucosylmutase
MSDVAAMVDTLVAQIQRRLAQRCWPAATYRLQFHPQHCTFRDAAALVPYQSQLGVSHVYASPYFQARSGSPHGYSVVDCSQLDPALGTADDYAAFVAALHEHGMGQILDLVPNHMSTTPRENQWWTNVLENGPSSPYADFFDIDWHPVKDELRNKVLLPVLGRQFGETLEAGELRLNFCDGAFFVDYYEHQFPLDPHTYSNIINYRLEEFRASVAEDAPELRELESIATAADHLPPRTDATPERVQERQREKEVIKDRLRRLTAESPHVAEFLQQNLDRLNGNPGEPGSFDLLERILNSQVYRFSHWKAASDEINYRRFFDVNELAAVCMEDDRVFETCHAFVFDLLARGDVNGLRIDHVDGLFDPLEYLWRLQWGYIRTVGRHCWEGLADPELPAWSELEPQVLAALWPDLGGPSPFQLFPGLQSYSSLPSLPVVTPQAGGFPDASKLPLYVVVEKILGPEEPLPREWPVAGTSGYEFLNCTGGVFVDPVGLRQLVTNYRRFTQEPIDFHEVAYLCKLFILRVSMSSELYLLTHRLNRISERHRLTRDFTMNTLRTALREVFACFPVYRTYVGAAGVNERDSQIIRRAVARAIRRNPAMDVDVFHFIRGVLLLEQPPRLDSAGQHQRRFFVGRFQQVTSPVMAKGVEDTAFYRYFPLVSSNEVGGEPARAAVNLQHFHEENLWRHTQQPYSLTCTTTHDTKRSEDVRARINVLSEIPQVWRKAVNRWARLNRRLLHEVEGEQAPSRNDQYLFYQTLVGVWPIHTATQEDHQQMIDRMAAYMEKATREAKMHTSWISPDAGYDEAVQHFVRTALHDDPKNRFLVDFREFHRQVVDWGLYSALSQVLLKLTTPGVPDIYQGQELWDFSLVDPDNRRPVDYNLRRHLLGELQQMVSAGDVALYSVAKQLASTPTDQRLKLFVSWRALRFRRQHADLFHRGSYIPLVVEGAQAEHVCAFAWQLDATDDRPEQSAVVVVPRWLALLNAHVEPVASGLPVGTGVWHETQVVLPESFTRPLVNLFTGQACAVQGGRLHLAAALSDFPVALLTSVG